MLCYLCGLDMSYIMQTPFSVFQYLSSLSIDLENILLLITGNIFHPRCLWWETHQLVLLDKKITIIYSFLTSKIHFPNEGIDSNDVNKRKEACVARRIHDCDITVLH